mgnify:CR=1 FL=1
MDRKITLLYVDDEPLNLILFQSIFKKNFNVTTANSGEEGLKILTKNDGIDTVISDMKMPGINGIEFIRRAKEKYPKINYFILTGFDITDEIADALRTELISGYFSKPINKKEIENAISESV